MSVCFLTDLIKAISCLLKNRYIYIRYSNGAGNNIFQYNFCYSLISNKKYVKIINPFCINKSMYSLSNRLTSRFILLINKFLYRFSSFISIIDNNSKNIPNSKIIFFEDTGEVLSSYEGKEEIIKKNFFKLNKSFLNFERSKKDFKEIVIHFRLGDRLFYKSNYQKGMYYDLDKLQNLLNKEIEIYDKKVIIIAVTDTPNILEINNKKDLENLKTHNFIPTNKRVDYSVALKYIKKIKNFIIFNDIRINKSKVISEDFSLMLKADILIFLHGTLSWWAGFLGSQSKVYSSKYWRPANLNNSYLSNYKSDRWFKW